LPCPIILINSEDYNLKKNKRLTQKEKIYFCLTQTQIDVIIGSALGDLFIRKLPNGKNAHLIFRQGLVHDPYLNLLYSLFQDFCNSGPKEQEHFLKKTNKKYNTKYFQTYSLPCFNEYYDLFYQNGKKIVPKNIKNLLSPRALAF